MRLCRGWKLSKNIARNNVAVLVKITGTVFVKDGRLLSGYVSSIRDKICREIRSNQSCSWSIDCSASFFVVLIIDLFGN